MLKARKMKENFGQSTMSGKEFEMQKARLQGGEEWLLESAESGDADAIWVLEQLDAEEVNR